MIYLLYNMYPHIVAVNLNILLNEIDLLKLFLVPKILNQEEIILKTSKYLLTTSPPARSPQQESIQSHNLVQWMLKMIIFREDQNLINLRNRMVGLKVIFTFYPYLTDKKLLEALSFVK